MKLHFPGKTISRDLNFNVFLEPWKKKNKFRYICFILVLYCYICLLFHLAKITVLCAATNIVRKIVVIVVSKINDDVSRCFVQPVVKR